MTNEDPPVPSTFVGDLESPGARSEIAHAVIAGNQATYRLGFTSMRVTALPERLQIGEVTVEQVVGPIETQRTTIIQVPGWQPTFEKWMERPLIGAGRPLTIYSLPVTLPADNPLGEHERWRAHVLACVGFLAILLDERLAQEEILEDIVIPLDESVATLDIVRRLRTFEPTHPWFEEFGSELDRFTAEGIRLQMHAACRWYLQAVTAGPTADGFVLLWVALECILASPDSNTTGTTVQALENALKAADPDLDVKSVIDPPIGRLFGLRSQIVHEGLESDPLIADGYYTLESLTRLLLRSRFGVVHGWPYFPAQPMLAEPFVHEERQPRVVWREPPNSR